MIQILISIVISAGLIVGSFNVPASWFDVTPNRLGASVTTLNGTENLSDFPTLYNANLNSLNTTKLESGDTAAALTITDLTATNAPTFTNGLTETNGGTGQQTYTTGDLLYASASNVLSKLGIGSNGQSLIVSGGIPVWDDASVNESLDYNWTGHHTFTSAALALASTTNATSTTSHYFPFLTSTLLKTDGNGKLIAAVGDTDYVIPSATSFASTTVATTTSSSGTYNSDYAFTSGFEPNVIEVNYWLQGKDGANTNIYSVGRATYLGDTITSNFIWKDNTASTVDFSITEFEIDASSPSAGDGGNAARYTLSIPTVTSTGFTLRVAHDGGSSFPGAEAKISVTAHK